MVKDAVPLAECGRALMIKLCPASDVPPAGPVLSVLKARGVEVDALVYDDSGPLLQGHPSLAQLHVVGRNWSSEGMLSRLSRERRLFLDLKKRRYGLIVNLSDVLFDTAQATLKPGAREKLARVSGILVTHPDLKLEIEGHTDSVGSEPYNQGLSERRAESVRSYLVSQRIAAQTITTAGFGESRPVATNATAAGRQQNRRVELVVSGEAIGTH